MKKIIWISLLPLALVSFTTETKAQDPSTNSAAIDMAKPMNETDFVWGDPPPSLPKGAKLAVLAGDPSKEGPITLRVIFPPNYKMAAHTHLGVENVTVLKGTLYVGMGDKIDMKNATLLKAGAFFAIPTTGPHFAFTKEGCTFEVHTMGPFIVNYANAADDPSKH